MLKPKIAITLGDPAGIGPEIVSRAVNSLQVQRVCSPVVLGDKNVIEKYFNVNDAGLSFKFTSCFNKIQPGKPSKISGIIACNAIKEASHLCINKSADAMVTAPVSKESFKLAGLKYAGHTEFLASLAKTKKYCMIMVCGSLNSVMVTRHLPFCEISNALNKKNIVMTAGVACSFIKSITGKKPKIIVCALNPHAGDNGILGLEEKKFIIPAVKELKNKKYDITGPVSADVAWAQAVNGRYDLIIGMYHDQIMIPLKVINDKKVVNVTAGLGFLRTSPGHGTAFDIAGKNKADFTSMQEAIIYAAKFSCKK